MNTFATYEAIFTCYSGSLNPGFNGIEVKRILIFGKNFYGVYGNQKNRRS